MSRVEDEVRRRMGGLDRHGLVAVSGGPDSVALLLALERVGVNFTVVHVNHKLRGEESDEDEKFVRELANRLSVPFGAKTLPVPPGESIESTARTLRYDWFREIAVEFQCGWIATAHTADDQTETVLHRIIRGTGIQGLVGIQSREWHPSLVLLRPLLLCRRSELIEYLSALNQSFRIDKSNLDFRFTRNRIRHEILPALKQINPQVEEAVLRLSGQAAELESYLFTQVGALYARSKMPDAGDVSIWNAEILEQAELFLVRELFRMIWQSNDWPMGNMTESHWQRLAELQSADFPGGISVRRVGKVVQLWRKP